MERTTQQSGMGRLIVIVLITLLPVLAIAQDEPEYRAEIGAGVGLAAYDADAGYQVVAIDVNGSKGPNIAGVDYFELKIIGVNDFDTGEHIGDVGAFQTENSLSDVQSSCKNGVAADCYYLVEHSGFDSDYVNKDYTVKKSD